ncbi:hypothetical protein ECC02_002439 [Trypanosoma cruzi]|uniref:Uncharacterized protein n=1 Tax=Trypanosoma cruzi TaxID=5693 RepID=A0A7J6YDL9_TRYCR|nr:hypothetical protein ECC02_002439 [Trypanosoma cruzi]
MNAEQKKKVKKAVGKTPHTSRVPFVLFFLLRPLKNDRNAGHADYCAGRLVVLHPILAQVHPVKRRPLRLDDPVAVQLEFLRGPAPHLDQQQAVVAVRGEPAVALRVNGRRQDSLAEGAFEDCVARAAATAVTLLRLVHVDKMRAGLPTAVALKLHPPNAWPSGSNRKNPFRFRAEKYSEKRHSCLLSLPPLPFFFVCDAFFFFLFMCVVPPFRAPPQHARTSMEEGEKKKKKKKVQTNKSTRK